jgi:hypothetical protein
MNFSTLSDYRDIRNDSPDSDLRQSISPSLERFLSHASIFNGI